MRSLSLSLILGLLISIPAWAIPEAPFNALTTEVLAEELNNDPFDFNGIVALSNCSASLVHFAGQPKSSEAYVLTNGHCIGGWGGFLRPGEIEYYKPSRKSMNVHRTVNERVRVQSHTLVYATMTGTDSALYRLNETYAQLEAQGIQSFEMAWEQPLVGQPIHIVSGYWKRGFECAVEATVFELHEADWVFTDSIRYSDPGCEVYGGTSGSPVVARGERVVIGVNNTGNESGRECTMNNPCEVDENGTRTVLEGRGYAQQTYWFYSCLTEGFEIDLEREGCLLEK